MNYETQKQTLDDWLSRHRGIIFKIVRAFAGTPHDQDDLFQEISIQLWRSIPDFRGEAKVSTWIYRVALFAATVWARSERKQPDTRPLDDVVHVLRVKESEMDEQVRWLYREIGMLEPVDRSLCVLLLEGFSYREMAELVGMSESNVGVRIHRIKKNLSERSRE